MSSFNNIYLCGFMGCGKTIIGKALAKILNMQFVDLDEIIVQDAKMSIPDIFDKYGEAFFRSLENKHLLELAKQNNLVVATGGGAVIPEINTKICKSSGKIIYLNSDYEKCYERICGDINRPIVQQKSKQELLELYKSRAEIYKSICDYEVDSTGNADDIAEFISNECFGG